jgi:hypothetical protein
MIIKFETSAICSIINLNNMDKKYNNKNNNEKKFKKKKPRVYLD